MVLVQICITSSVLLISDLIEVKGKRTKGRNGGTGKIKTRTEGDESDAGDTLTGPKMRKITVRPKSTMLEMLVRF